MRINERFYWRENLYVRYIQDRGRSTAFLRCNDNDAPVHSQGNLMHNITSQMKTNEEKGGRLLLKYALLPLTGSRHSSHLRAKK